MVGRYFRFLVLSLVMVGLASQQAHAAPAAGTIGEAINNVSKANQGWGGLLSGLAYIVGILFAITGVFKFKDHVDNPQQTPISAGIKRFLAGGMLFALPFMRHALVDSLFNGKRDVLQNTAFGNGAPVGGGMDQLIHDLVLNFAAPMQVLLEIFCFIGGTILLITGIIRLTKTAQEGPRGPTGLGTLMTFLAAGGLYSFGGISGVFANSIFGDATTHMTTVINPTVIGAAAATQVQPVIDAVMVFIMLVGYIAFIRGWFVLKSFADGNAQVSIAQAITFLFGGSLAINLGDLVNVISKTVGVSTITFV
jgi:hypothetical protein